MTDAAPAWIPEQPHNHLPALPPRTSWKAGPFSKPASRPAPHWQNSSKRPSSCLSRIHDPEEATQSVLVHGENFQALNLLDERHREQFKTIYINSPYTRRDSMR